MLRIDIPANLKLSYDRLKKFGQVAPLAAAKALTFTAERVAKALKEQMPATYDRPTPWTLNAWFIKPATPADLTAMVKAKDQGRRAHNKYLINTTEGTPRRVQKAFEKKLQGMGVLPAGWVVIPGKGAQLDAFGALDVNYIRRILARVAKATSATTPTLNPKTGKARVVRSKGGAMDIVVSRPEGRAKAANGGNLPWGIWQREGQTLKCLLFFVPKASYRKLLDLRRLADDVTAKEFPALYEKALEREFKKAKL